MMTRSCARSLIVVGVLVGGLAVPGVASAQEPPTGRDFGHHVSGHARAGMLDGDMNPGMHQGVAGWPGHTGP